MIKDTPEGTTHSYEDGCNPPHEYPTPKTIDDIPVKDTNRESDEYDAGLRDMKAQCIDLLHTAIAEATAILRKSCSCSECREEGTNST